MDTLMIPLTKPIFIASRSHVHFIAFSNDGQELLGFAVFENFRESIRMLPTIDNLRKMAILFNKSEILYYMALYGINDDCFIRCVK